MKIFDRDYSQAKTYLEGAHRARRPAETLVAYKPFMPEMGIVRLANVTGLDFVGLPVVVAVRPNSRSLAVSQGKGLDLDAASASALMESIENWHAERIEAPLRYESYQALRRTAPVIDISGLHRYRAEGARADLPLLWVQGFDLLQQRVAWVPEEAVGTNMVIPPESFRMFVRSSNGLASGNHILEAIVHALCEVIERDAVSLWYHFCKDQDSSRIDLATVDDPACCFYLERLRRAGLIVAAWDVTSDLGIPTYAATLVDEPGLRAVGIFSGFGCHLSPAVALFRALSEAVQARLTFIAGSRDDLPRKSYAASVARRSDEELAALRGLLESLSPPVSFRSRPSSATASFEGDLSFLLESLTRTGLESVVVVDLSKPDLGIPVVKVLVPHLEGFFAHKYYPGRRARALQERCER